MLKDFYTVRDIAEQLQVKEKAIRHLISTGELKANKVCSKWVVTAENLKMFVEGSGQVSESQERKNETLLRMANDYNELTAVLKNRDFERYKIFMDYDNQNEFERDNATLDFEQMCKTHHKEWKSPNEYLSFGLQGLLNIASKHNIDTVDIFSELERRHK